MPTVDNGPSLSALAAIARGALEIKTIEFGLVAIAGTDGIDMTDFVMVVQPETPLFLETGERVERVAFKTSPTGGVLIHQDLRKLLESRGGVIAILRSAMNEARKPAPPSTPEQEKQATADASAIVAAISPAFEGSER